MHTKFMNSRRDLSTSNTEAMHLFLSAPATLNTAVQRSWLLETVSSPAGLMLSGEGGTGRHNENESTGRVQ